MTKYLFSLFLGAAMVAACGSGEPTGPQSGSGSDTSAGTDGTASPSSTDTLYTAGSDVSGGNGSSDSATDSSAFLQDTNEGFSECADIPWQVETKPINILVLIDRSKSMEQGRIDDGDTDPTNNPTYADVVNDAIRQVVAQNTQAGIVNFALNAFPSPQECTAAYGNDTDNQQRDVVCQAASRFTSADAPFDDPLVPFADTISMDTYTAISSALDAIGQCGGTPTSKSLEWALTYLESLNLTDDTFVLVATDGAPNCNPTIPESTCRSSVTPGQIGEDFSEMCLDDSRSFQAILDLYKAGFKTFIIGVGEDVQQFSDTLNKMAYYGSGTVTSSTPPDPPDGRAAWYYPATNTQEVNAAFESITNSAVACEFEVPWEDVPDEIPSSDPDTPPTPVDKSCSQVRVKPVLAKDDSQGPELRYDALCAETEKDGVVQYGWRWADDAMQNKTWSQVKAESDVNNCRRISLCPKACEQLKIHNGVRQWKSVAASFGCEPILLLL